MPYSTPNRVAYPTRLESLPEPLAIVRQDGGLYLNFVNRLALSIMAGEVVLHNGRVCIVRRTILPGAEGVCITDWLCDFRVSDDLAANIYVNDTVWWDYSDNSIAAGIGAVVRAAPTNGFILGRAVAMPGRWTVASGNDQVIACEPGQTRVRVAPVATATAILGTIPQWTNTYS